MSEALKPCPFCGGEAKIAHCPDEPLTLIACGPCGVDLHSPRWSKIEHIAAWNRRSLERLSCCRCGKEMPVYGPAGNPNMEICSPCHMDVDVEMITCAGGWVSVEDRLPEEGPWVLIQYDERAESGEPDDTWVAVACLVDNGWVTSTRMSGITRVETPTHWMPLPDPPERVRPDP